MSSDSNMTKIKFNQIKHFQSKDFKILHSQCAFTEIPDTTRPTRKASLPPATLYVCKYHNEFDYGKNSIDQERCTNENMSKLKTLLVH